MKSKLKSTAVLALAIASFGTLSGVAAATQYPGGGVWTYGASNGGAYSNYYHGSKYHSSTVVSRKNPTLVGGMLTLVELHMRIFARLGENKQPFIIITIN